MKFIKKYIFSVLFFVFVFFIIYTFSKIMQCCGFFYDDYWYSTYYKTERIFECLKFGYTHGGGYIGFFLSKFFSFYLPNLFNIHPAYFQGVWHSIIKASFTAIIILLYAKFATVYVKSKMFYISIVSFVFAWFLYAFTKVHT